MKRGLRIADCENRFPAMAVQQLPERFLER
jgi:hypothetical protein